MLLVVVALAAWVPKAEVRPDNQPDNHLAAGLLTDTAARTGQLLLVLAGCHHLSWAIVAGQVPHLHRYRV
jgi:hypothetical protein